MKNYAGHRLAPWLGHIMVSRSETARPLLTPGEVMQLPPEDEIVMVAGTPPIRARKARYYTDPRFRERMLSPPDPREAVPSARADDWTGLTPPKPDGLVEKTDVKKEEGRAKRQDKANSGLRREPELPEHVEIVHERKEPSPEDEFRHLLGDDQEDAVRQRQALRRKMAGVARQTSMDPGDDIPM